MCLFLAASLRNPVQQEPWDCLDTVLSSNYFELFVQSPNMMNWIRYLFQLSSCYFFPPIEIVPFLTFKLIWQTCWSEFSKLLSMIVSDKSHEVAQGTSGWRCILLLSFRGIWGSKMCGWTWLHISSRYVAQNSVTFLLIWTHDILELANLWSKCDRDQWEGQYTYIWRHIRKAKKDPKATHFARNLSWFESNWKLMTEHPIKRKVQSRTGANKQAIFLRSEYWNADQLKRFGTKMRECADGVYM